jgi:hypothetical protein
MRTGVSPWLVFEGRCEPMYSLVLCSSCSSKKPIRYELVFLDRGHVDPGGFPPEEALYKPEIYQRISIFALIKHKIWERSREIMIPAMLKYSNKILL